MHDHPPPTSLPTQLHIVAWSDAVIDALGFAPHHPYSEVVWLPRIGPSSVLAWRRLAGLLLHHPDGYPLDVAAFAQDLGLGTGTGAHSPLARTLRRLVQFELAAFVDDITYAVRRRIPPASASQLCRLSPQLQRLHAGMLADHDAQRLARRQSSPLRRGA